MASSEYLSIKAEGGERKPAKGAFYTGIAYIAVVILLILPYLVLEQLYLSLIFAILIAAFIILFFTFYTSVAMDASFGKRFLEMLFISLGVAALSFGVGFLVRHFFNIEV